MMADEREVVPDADFFSSVMEEKTEPPQEQPKEDQQQEQPDGERARDDQGRFAAKTEEEPATDEAPPAPATQERQETDHRIPLRELLDERERRQNAERERQEWERRARDYERRVIEAQKPAEEAPDIFADPDKFWQAKEQQLEQKFEKRILDMSLGRAHVTYGKEFEEAFGAVDVADGGIKARIRNAPDPGEALMDWHRREKTMREIGPDPGAYRTKLADELLKDPAFRQKVIDAARTEAAGGGQTTQRPNINMPSLSRAPAASRDVNVESSDEQFFHDNLRLRRR